MWSWITEDAREADRVLRDVLAPLLKRDPDVLRDQLCVGPRRALRRAALALRARRLRARVPLAARRRAAPDRARGDGRASGADGLSAASGPRYGDPFVVIAVTLGRRVSGRYIAVMSRFTATWMTAGLCATLAIAVSAGPVSAATAPGQVFAPNPVADLGIQTLTDQKDADFFSADPFARARLPPRDADQPRRLGHADRRLRQGRSARPASRPRNTGSGFIYTRDQDQFEQVMGYYWITQAQRYIQSLGFGSTLPAVNKRQQLLRIDQYGGDNSFYRDGTGKLTITLGKGGVDDAEDAEVIVHEYGHSVQDNQVPGFGSTADAGAIGEAFGDYLAVDRLRRLRADRRRGLRRRLGLDLLHAGDAALPAPRRRRQALSRGPATRARSTPTARSGRAPCGTSAARSAPALADTIIIRAQFGFTPDISMPAAAEVTIATAGLYGKSAQKAVRAAFAARGLA